ASEHSSQKWKQGGIGGVVGAQCCANLATRISSSLCCGNRGHPADVVSLRFAARKESSQAINRFVESSATKAQPQGIRCTEIRARHGRDAHLIEDFAGEFDRVCGPPGSNPFRAIQNDIESAIGTDWLAPRALKPVKRILRSFAVDAAQFPRALQVSERF